MNDFGRFSDAWDRSVLDPNFEAKAKKSEFCIKWREETKFEKFVRYGVLMSPYDYFKKYDMMDYLGKLESLKAIGLIS